MYDADRSPRCTKIALHGGAAVLMQLEATTRDYHCQEFLLFRLGYDDARHRDRTLPAPPS